MNLQYDVMISFILLRVSPCIGVLYFLELRLFSLNLAFSIKVGIIEFVR